MMKQEMFSIENFQMMRNYSSYLQKKQNSSSESSRTEDLKLAIKDPLSTSKQKGQGYIPPLRKSIFSRLQKKQSLGESQLDSSNISSLDAPIQSEES